LTGALENRRNRFAPVFPPPDGYVAEYTVPANQSEKNMQQMNSRQIPVALTFWFILPTLFVILGQYRLPAWAASTPAQGAASGTFDGPAELPRVYVKSSMADTPASGRSRLVKAGDNLQQALDSAACGDTIKLEVGATFTGHFRLPNKPCDDRHWIIVRTSAPDESLPPEGTRISPCYAGIGSLPGRPDFYCKEPRNVMARISFAGKGGSGPLFLSPGANHYRLLGLEVTREPSDAKVTALAGPEGPVAADHIIFDRMWFHGTAHDETTRGVFLSGTTFMAVVDSFFSDFHCVAGGSCTDSQAIAGGAGNLPMGPFKVVNNFLEAAGENIILGGSAATSTPADIEIRHNYFYKPQMWMPGHEGFVGGASGRPFIVKNLFELKNAQRLLFEGNVLENTWGGFSQAGFAILLTPKNQSPNVCPLCRVTDITIRFDKISHVGGGMQIANVLSDTGGASTAGERYSIHDVTFDDIDGAAYKGFGLFAMLASSEPPLRDVKIDHVTAFPSRVLLNIGATRNKLENFVFTNNLLYAGERQITSTGGGGENCAFQSDRQGPAGVLKNCFTSATVAHNVIVGGSGWPSGNFTPGDFKAVGFVDHRGGKGGNYRLCKNNGEAVSCRSESKFVRAGTDGKDIGADMDAIEAATRGVI
jgi:hypothetical protein